MLELIMNWPEGTDCGISPEQEVTHAEDGPFYNELSESE